MTKATKNGHCQNCGRVHAVSEKKGQIVNHGYIVRWGSFNGICGGAAYEPLEVSRDHLDANVFWLRTTAEALEADMNALTADRDGLRLQMHNRLVYNAQTALCDGKTRVEREDIAAKWYTKQEFIALSVAHDDNHADYRWDSAVEVYRAVNLNEVAQMRGHAEMLLKLAENVHGQPLQDRETGPKRETKSFSSADRRAGYAFAEEQRKAGKKVTTRRDQWTGGVTVYF